MWKAVKQANSSKVNERKTNTQSMNTCNATEFQEKKKLAGGEKGRNGIWFQVTTRVSSIFVTHGFTYVRLYTTAAHCRELVITMTLEASAITLAGCCKPQAATSTSGVRSDGQPWLEPSYFPVHSNNHFANKNVPRYLNTQFLESQYKYVAFFFYSIRLQQDLFWTSQKK